MQHAAMDCVCLSSDRTGAYVHELSIAVSNPDAPSAELSPVPEGPAPQSPSFEGDIHSVTRRPGLVPYVSQRAGAYGRSLLATYVHWQTGLLTACDWLRPVTCGELTRGSTKFICSVVLGWSTHTFYILVACFAEMLFQCYIARPGVSTFRAVFG